MLFEEIAKSLIVYGPLGILALIALFVAWQKDKELTTLRDDFLVQLTELAAKHKIEMQALEERYISKAETWMTKYHDQSGAQQQVIEALMAKGKNQ